MQHGLMDKVTLLMQQDYFVGLMLLKYYMQITHQKWKSLTFNWKFHRNSNIVWYRKRNLGSFS